MSATKIPVWVTRDAFGCTWDDTLFVLYRDSCPAVDGKGAYQRTGVGKTAICSIPSAGSDIMLGECRPMLLTLEDDPEAKT